jgi:hypothetical protein
METVVMMQHHRWQRPHRVVNVCRCVAKRVAAAAPIAIAAAHSERRRQKRRRGRVVMRRYALIGTAKTSARVCASVESVHGVVLHRVIERRIRAARVEKKVDVFFSLCDESAGRKDETTT